MKIEKYIDAFRASRLPGLLLAVAILLMPIEPKYWLPDRFSLAGFELGTWRNIVLLLLVAPYVLQKGWRRPLNPVAVGYTIVLLTTVLLATPMPELSLFQSVKSFAFLLLGPFILYELKHDRQDIDRYLKLLSLGALVNLFAGIVLFLARVHPVIILEYGTGALRLAGAGIPASLALTGFVSMLASLVLSRDSRNFLYLVGLNLLIVVLTGTRGSTVAAVVVMAAFIVNEWRTRGWPEARRVLVPAAIGLACGVLLYAPNYALRFKLTPKEKQYLYSVAPQSDTQELEYAINTSGRTKTWLFYWGLVKPNLPFGRGIGAGTLADQLSDRTLRVPHNEYLRFLVEGGLFGLIVMLVAYALQFLNLYRIAQPDYRIFLLGFVLIYAALAMIENVISGQTISVLLWTFFGLFRERLLQAGGPAQGA